MVWGAVGEAYINISTTASTARASRVQVYCQISFHFVSCRVLYVNKQELKATPRHHRSRDCSGSLASVLLRHARECYSVGVRVHIILSQLVHLEQVQCTDEGEQLA